MFAGKKITAFRNRIEKKQPLEKLAGLNKDIKPSENTKYPMFTQTIRTKSEDSEAIRKSFREQPLLGRKSMSAKTALEQAKTQDPEQISPYHIR